MASSDIDVSPTIPISTRIQPSSSPTGSFRTNFSQSSNESRTSNRSRFSFYNPGILNVFSFKNITSENTTPTKKTSNLIGAWYKPKPKPENVKLVEGLVQSKLTPPFRFIRKIEYNNRHGGPHSGLFEDVEPERQNILTSFIENEERYIAELSQLKASISNITTIIPELAPSAYPILDSLNRFQDISEKAIDSAKFNHDDCGILQFVREINEAYEPYANNFSQNVEFLFSAKRQSEQIDIDIPNPKEWLVKPLVRLVYYRFHLHHLQALIPQMDLIPRNFQYPIWWINVKNQIGELSVVLSRIYKLFEIEDSFEDVREQQDRVDTSRCRTIDPTPEKQKKEQSYHLYLFLTYPLPYGDKLLPVSPKHIDMVPMTLIYNNGWKKLFKQTKNGKLRISKNLSGEATELHIFTDMFMITTRPSPENNKWSLLYPPMPKSHAEIVCNSHDQFEGEEVLIEIKLSPYKMVVAKVTRDNLKKLKRGDVLKKHQSNRSTSVISNKTSLHQSTVIKNTEQPSSSPSEVQPIPHEEHERRASVPCEAPVEKPVFIQLRPIDLPLIKTKKPDVLKRIDEYVSRVVSKKPEVSRPTILFEQNSKPRLFNPQSKEWDILAPCVIRIYQSERQLSWLSIDLETTYKSIFSSQITSLCRASSAKTKSVLLQMPSSEGNMASYMLPFSEPRLAQAFMTCFTQIQREGIKRKIEEMGNNEFQDPPVILSYAKEPITGLSTPFIDQRFAIEGNSLLPHSIKANCTIIHDDDSCLAIGDVDAMIVATRGPAPKYLANTRLILFVRATSICIMQTELDGSRLTYNQSRNIVKLRVQETQTRIELSFPTEARADSFVAFLSAETVNAKKRREDAERRYELHCRLREQEELRRQLLEKEAALAAVADKDKCEIIPQECKIVKPSNQDHTISPSLGVGDDLNESSLINATENLSLTQNDPENNNDQLQRSESPVSCESTVKPSWTSEATLADEAKDKDDAADPTSSLKQPVPPSKEKMATFRRTRLLRESTGFRFNHLLQPAPTEAQLREMKRRLEEIKQLREVSQQENEALMSQLRELLTEQHKLRVAECELKKIAKKTSSFAVDMSY